MPDERTRVMRRRLSRRSPLIAGRTRSTVDFLDLAGDGLRAAAGTKRIQPRVCSARGVPGSARRRDNVFVAVEEVPVIFSLELVTVPVADVDRAKAFYVDRLGFQADMDVRTEGNRRFVRLTPPGSTCCIAIGEGWINSQPGSMQGSQLVVEDIDEAQAFLRASGVEVSEVQTFPWGRFCFFADPDGNGWSVQEPPATP